MIRNKITIDGSTRKKDKTTGYLTCDVLAAKVGVQEYHHTEIGVEPVDDNGLVKVARLPESVFDAISLDSWSGIDLTNDHPDGGLVDADNYQAEAIGNTLGKATQDSDHIRVRVVVKDAQAIKDLEQGKSEVSAGYTADYIKQSGVFNDEAYDYIQTNIKLNHLALVDRGRAKSAIVLDSEEVMIEELKAQIEALEEQVTELNKRPTFDALAQLVQVTKDAESINADGEYANKDAEAIKREALGDKVTLDHSSDVVDYVFTMTLDSLKTISDEVVEAEPTIVLDAEVVNDEPSARSLYMKSLGL